MSVLRQVTIESSRRRLREEVLSTLRKQMNPSLARRIFTLLFGCLCILNAFVHGLTQTVDGHPPIAALFWLAMGVFWVISYVQMKRPSARDRLWLILAEEVLEKEALPNHSPLQTPTSGTPAAGAPVAPPSGAAGL